MKKLNIHVWILALICLLQVFTAFSAESKPVNPFVIQDKSTQVYRDRTSQLTYSRIDRTPIVEALAALPKLTVASTPSREKRTVAFLSVDVKSNYQKHKYELRPGELRYDGIPYALTLKQYDSLQKAFGEASKEGANHPQWLVWMNPNRVTSLKSTYKTGIVNKTYTVNSGPGSDNLLSLAKVQRNIKLASNKAETYDPRELNIRKFGGVTLQTVMMFDSGVTCTVVMHNNSLYVESSDKSYGCRYEINEDTFYRYEKDMEWYEPDNECDDEPDEVVSPEDLPPLGKPVIYLYPEKTADVSVKLDFKGKIRYTYPAYNGGWNVTASPDGRIVDKSDRSEHWYLFWDGDPDFTYWDFERGFCVKGSEIEGFLKDKLPKLGLTPKEYNDFITYWTPILSLNKYNLITFSTVGYENISGLDITPAPDTVLRVNMVYKAVDAPVTIPEQKLPEAPERKGFTVVEWGAMRAR